MIQDDKIAPRDPLQVDVSNEVLAMLVGADRICFIGHENPDVDAAASILSGGSGLGKMAKTVDVVLDDDLPGVIRQIEGSQNIRRPAELAEKAWDLVVIADVAMVHRIGKDAPELLQRSEKLMMIDHHRGYKPPDLQAFGIANQDFCAWVDEDFPCVSLMVFAILRKLEEAGHITLSRDDKLRLLLGFATDLKFNVPTGLVEPEFLEYFKYMFLQVYDPEQWSPEKAMADLAARTSYQLPPLTAERLDALPVETIEDSALVVVGQDQIASILEQGKREDPDLVSADLLNYLKARVQVLAGNYDRTILLTEEPSSDHPQRYRTSIRSREGVALLLARHTVAQHPTQCGGHGESAGSTLVDLSPSEAVHRIREALTMPVSELRERYGKDPPRQSPQHKGKDLP